MHLVELALDFAERMLFSGDDFPVKVTVKVLQDRDFQPLLQQLCGTSSLDLPAGSPVQLMAAVLDLGGQKRLQGSDSPEFLRNL